MKEPNKTWKVFIIPHWHFDALWQLPFEEYFIITSENMMDLLEFLDTEPKYKFCLDQTVYIEKFIECFPELKDDLIRAVKSGLIELVGSGYTQPDTNLPSGEFLVRNLVLHKTFVRRIFNVDVECGWYIDTYGQSGQLPQIFSKCGIKYFVFWRGCPVQDSKEPPTEFLWEGIDGTRILTHWMPLGYGAYLPSGKRRYDYFITVEEKSIAIMFLERLFERLKRKASTNNVFIPNGGDFAPPQRNLPSIIQEWQKRRDDLDICIATPKQFFRAIEPLTKNLPVVRGEFNPIFRGTYSTRIKIKQANRKVESLYLTAEKFATIASLFDLPYPNKLLDKALKLILLNQFHDAINGEVIDEVYKKIMKDYEKAEEICNEVLEDALKNIVSRIDTRGEGIPLVIFNPLSWRRTDVVEVKIGFGKAGVRSVLLKDLHGQNIPFQLSHVSRNPDGTLNNVNLVFIADDVPALGYKTYFVIPSDQSGMQEFETSIRTSSEKGRYRIENEYYSVTIDPVSKMITSIYDKELEKEVLKADKYLGNVLFSEPDYGSVCHINGDIDAHNTSIPIKDLPDPEVVENTMKCVSSGIISEEGPVKATISINGRLDGFKFRQHITLYDKIKRIDFRTDIEFEGEHRRIRVAFPIDMENGEIWHEIPYGAIRRGEGEYPAINWIDLSNQDYGVTLINKGLPGNSVVKNIMLITLLRSIDAMYLRSPFRDPRLERVGRMYLEGAERVSLNYPMGRMALEKGSHTFNYALYPHKCTWREAKSYNVALEFNNPLVCIKASKHEGSLPKEYSFLSITPNNLVVTVIKRSNKNVLIRFYEAEGREAKGKLFFFKKVKSVWKTNLLGERGEKVNMKSGEVHLQAQPFEIVTLLMEIE